ncbi:hypothetical protein SPI_01780 [Niveomyces insectorum RCEF 264]|uniref:Uncharacterized protein n=1 Tax=Niveomyces insectorum RCEF 264 TaxID=1081102 RepID=A0A167Z8B0_9HYPO|nr:hypothetical protein SPI_01780 [Niveomyces insectorum RCEF 264]
MPDSPSAAAAAAAHPVTPPSTQQPWLAASPSSERGADAATDSLATPTSPPQPPPSSSFYTRSPAATHLLRSLSYHALGISGLSPRSLQRRLVFYDDGGDTDEDSVGTGAGDGGGPDTKKEDDGDEHGAANGHGGDEDVIDYDFAAEDSKDVLLDRLHDMARHVAAIPASSPSLSSQRSASGTLVGADGTSRPRDGSVVSALHAHIDEMEAEVAAAMAAAAASAANVSTHHSGGHHHHHHQQDDGHARRHRSNKSRASSESVAHSSPQSRQARRTAPFLQAAPLLFSERSSPSVLQHAGSPTEHRPRPPSTHATTADAANRPVAAGVSKSFAGNCDALADDLSTVLANLTNRSQEAEAIQQTLLRQLAAANQRAAQLEVRVQALTKAQAQAQAQAKPWSPPAGLDGTTYDQSDVYGGDGDDDDNRWAALDSELSFLRLQLRGIEVRCRPYLSDDADPELTESIENWKADWTALRARVEEEQRSHTGLGSCHGKNGTSNTQ